MNPPKILLIQPPIRDFYLTRKRTIPYGLAAICANLDPKRFSTRIIDALATDKSRVIPYPESFAHLKTFYGRKDLTAFSLFHDFRHFGYAYEHIGKLVKDEAPFLVGISSLFTPYTDEALETARTVKNVCPKAWVVLGGHHPTRFPREVLAEKAVDFVLRGEGEASFQTLCQALLDGTSLEKVPGIAFRKKEGVFSREPAWIEDFSKFSMPAFEKTAQAYYRRHKKAAITVVSSRGCPMPCSYCAVSSTSCHAEFRRRSVKNVLAEIQQQASQGDVGFIDFEDENFTLDKAWVMALLEGIQEIFKGKPVELRAMNGLFPPSLSDEIIKTLKESGFKTLNLSVGSFCQQILKRFKRPDVIKAHDRALDTAHALGMDCVSYVIAAAPGQDAETSLNDLLALAQRRTLAGLSIFYPAPGSLDYETCRQKGILPRQFSLMRSTALPIEDRTTPKEAVTLLRLSRVLNTIKSCIDQNELPSPKAPPSKTLAPETGRQALSFEILAYFLYDGILRGVEESGRIYPHEVDKNLCRNFLKGLSRIPLMGVRSLSRVYLDAGGGFKKQRI